MIFADGTPTLHILRNMGKLYRHYGLDGGGVVGGPRASR